MRHLIPILFVIILTGCETVQKATDTIPRQTKTRIVFDTTDLLYTGGLGEAGVEGFCKRIQTYLIKDFAELGITATSDSDPSAPGAKITVTLSAIETTGGAGVDLFLGNFSTQKTRAKYSATLQSPSGTIVATWRHEVDDAGVDRLTSHIAADITKYLKKGFK